MATIQIMRYLLECSGCKAIFSGSGGFSSVTEARAVAYAEGSDRLLSGIVDDGTGRTR